MAASKNLLHPISHPSEGRHWLWILSGELAFRLQEARQQNPGLWPKTLVLQIRHCMFVLIHWRDVLTFYQAYNTSRSKQAPFPFSRNPGLEYICKAAENLWTELVGTASEYDTKKAKKHAPDMQVTNVALSFTNVETLASGQRSIEGFFSQDRNKRKQFSDEFTDIQKRQSTKQLKLSDNLINIKDNPAVESIPLDLNIGFRCTRCHKWIQRVIEQNIDQGVALASLKMEHADFHFAEDLADADNDPLPFSNGQIQSRTNPKCTEKQKPRGIERFFTIETPKSDKV